MTVGEYLLELDRQRKNLAANLRAKGVTAADTETLAQLVPKVLQIQQDGGEAGLLTVVDEAGKPVN